MSSPESGIGKGILLKVGKGLEQMQFAKASDSLCTAVNIQLAIDVLKVHLDSANGKKQFLSYCLVGETLGDQARDFEFTGRKRINKTLAPGLLAAG